MTDEIYVFVADDHLVVREGIISLIEEDDQFKICGQASNGKEVLKKIQQMDRKPDVILMDINMPVMDGVQCTGMVFKQYGGGVKVLALTMVKQTLYIKKMLQAGASGYVLKNCDKMELFRAIQTVKSGETYFSQSVSLEIMNEMTKMKMAKKAAPYSPVVLTKRELEVLSLIVKDLSNREIAQQLHISVRTVETHKQNLLAKTEANNVAGLVVYAVKHKLVDIS